MINAKEVSSKRFEKAALGYKQEDVDDYLRELSLEIIQLQKDKDDCDKKIDVLADKIREYMRDEDALKDALLGAQRQGHQVIDEAKAAAAKILAEAQEKSDEILSDTKIQLEREKKNLINVQREADIFKNNLLTLYKDHINLIKNMPNYDEPEEQQVLDEDTVVEEQEAATV